MSELFRGHQLEEGLLQRVRSWRDAFPALVLIDALRVAGSPFYLALAWAMLGVQFLLVGTLPAQWLMDAIAAASPGQGPTEVTMMLPGLVRAAWLLLVVALWMFPAAVIARAGACYAAGRPQTFSHHVGGVVRRWPALLLLLVLPAVCVGMLAAAIALLSLPGRLWAEGGGWVSMAAGTLLTLGALPLAVLAGTVAVGALAAVPLASVAVGIEKHADSFDALSRGYEYLLRRPIQLAWYAVCAAIPLTLIGGFALLVAGAAAVIGAAGLQLGSGREDWATGFRAMMLTFPQAAVTTTLCGLLGAIYLLMRQAASGQEVEDIAVSPADTRPADLPALAEGHGPASDAATAAR